MNVGSPTRATADVTVVVWMEERGGRGAVAGRSSAEKVAIFKGLSSGRQDVYGTYNGRAVRQVKAAVTNRVILAHLLGKRPYGVYLLTGDRTRAIVVDFDRNELDLPVSFVATCRGHGLSTYIERSKSKGYHVWMFFEQQGVQVCWFSGNWTTTIVGQANRSLA